jgi:hypothetical protein
MLQKKATKNEKNARCIFAQDALKTVNGTTTIRGSQLVI